MAKKIFNDAATIAVLVKYARSLPELEQAMLRRARYGGMGTDIELANHKVGELFSYLLFEYPEYHDAPERPHEVSEFREALKRNATRLHSEHRVVVTLDRSKVYIHWLDDPRRPSV